MNTDTQTAVDKTLTEFDPHYRLTEKKVISPDLLLGVGSRYSNSGSAGMAYYSQIHVWYKGQRDVREWQWRDPYSASRDRHDLHISGIGEVKITPTAGKVEIRVELLNREHGSRYTTFAFDDKETEIFPELPEKKQAEFLRDFEAETARILARLEELWTRKVQMFTGQGWVSYERPSIMQQVLDTAHGIGAFVTKEQIDHREGGNRQTRFELFVMKAGDAEATLIREDHGYEKTGGIRAISIINLTPSHLQITTYHGVLAIDMGE